MEELKNITGIRRLHIIQHHKRIINQNVFGSTTICSASRRQVHNRNVDRTVTVCDRSHKLRRDRTVTGLISCVGTEL